MTGHSRLHDRVHDELERLSAEVSTDLTCLELVARRRGTRLRRRRRALVALGSASVVAVAVGAWSVAGPSPEAGAPYASGDPAASDPTTRAPGAGAGSGPTPARRPATATLDGPTTAALLDTMVGGVSEGIRSDYAGQGAPGGAPDTYAELRLTPVGDRGFGVVGVNVQGRDVIGDLRPFGCVSWMLDCESETMPDGDRLRTYRDRPDGAGDVRLVAERWTAGDTVRIVVAATNGLDLGGDRWDVSRPTAVLNRAAISEIATDARWAFEVPARYADAGRDLDPYTDLDSDGGWDSPTPAARTDDARR